MQFNMNDKVVFGIFSLILQYASVHKEMHRLSSARYPRSTSKYQAMRNRSAIFLKRSHRAVIKRRRKQRQWSVRPLNRTKHIHGFYNTLIKFMQKHDEEQFFKFTRMSIPVFQKLLNLLRERLTKRSIRRPISPEERLLITLDYLAHGDSLQSIAWDFRIGKTTACCIVRETCQAIWDILSPIVLKPLQEADWLQISNDFEEKWQLPNCVGAVDGKHISILCPDKSGSDFFCTYKKTFSIVLMAMCDANYIFTNVDIGAYGSQNDGSIFSDSLFAKKMEDGTLNLPPPKPIPNMTPTDPFPHFVAADAAFPLKSYIMRPYPGKALSVKERIFNYRLSRGRRVIENAFGILANRWRLLCNVIDAKLCNVERAVGAVICLHNFIMKERSAANPYIATFCNAAGTSTGVWPADSAATRFGANNATKTVYKLRDTLAEYFMSTGAVEWQWESINRGLVPDL